MTRILLDTSAILAHYLREPYSDAVARILSEPSNDVGMCTCSALELAGKLTAKGLKPVEVHDVLDGYRAVLTREYPVDPAVVNAAIRLRETTRPRLPAMDALIAGCAAAHHATLVHADAHFDTIPPSELRTRRLDVTSPIAVREPTPRYTTRKKPGKKRPAADHPTHVAPASQRR